MDTYKAPFDYVAAEKAIAMRKYRCHQDFKSVLTACAAVSPLIFALNRSLPSASKLSGDISRQVHAVFDNQLYVFSLVMALLAAIYALAHQHDEESARSPDIYEEFAVNRVYCRSAVINCGDNGGVCSATEKTPSFPETGSKADEESKNAVVDRAVSRETETTTEEEKKESGDEHPEKETTTEEEPFEDEYPERDMTMEEDSFEDECPEAESTAEEKSEDEYLKTQKAAEASKFWDFKHGEDLYPESIAEEEEEEEETVEYDQEIAGSTAQNIAAAIDELFPMVNDEESETDIEGWVPVPPPKPSDTDRVVVSDDKFERFIAAKSPFGAAAAC